MAPFWPIWGSWFWGSHTSYSLPENQASRYPQMCLFLVSFLDLILTRQFLVLEMTSQTGKSLCSNYTLCVEQIKPAFWGPQIPGGPNPGVLERGPLLGVQIRVFGLPIPGTYLKYGVSALLYLVCFGSIPDLEKWQIVKRCQKGGPFWGTPFGDLFSTTSRVRILGRRA